jgi:hypothetical protein
VLAGRQEGIHATIDCSAGTFDGKRQDAVVELSSLFESLAVVREVLRLQFVRGFGRRYFDHGGRYRRMQG